MSSYEPITEANLRLGFTSVTMIQMIPLGGIVVERDNLATKLGGVLFWMIVIIILMAFSVT